MAVKARIEAIAHATEDPGFVASMFEVVGVDASAFSANSTTGHFGSEITVLEAELSGRGALALAAGLAKEAPRGQLLEAAGRVSGSTLLIRLDKQQLASGRVRIDGGGGVRVRITAPVYKGDARAVFAGILGLD